MSAPVRVRRNVFGQWVAYCYACPTGSGTVSHCDAQPVALAAALAHLRLYHETGRVMSDAGNRIGVWKALYSSALAQALSTDPRTHWNDGFRQGKSVGRGEHECLDCESGDPHACVVADRDAARSEVAKLRATVDRCREFLSEPVAVLSDGAVRDAYRMARAALDPDGGAS